MARQGQPLPAHVVEGIKQMYAAEGNKSLVARAFNVNLSTVYRVLGREDPEIARERRREALGQLASKLSDNALRLADDLSTVPEDASYMQKATVMGITVDKVEKLDKRLDDQHKDDRAEAGELVAMPNSIDEIHGLLRNDLRFLVGVLGASVLQGLVPKEHQDNLTDELQAVEAEVEKLSDLDIGANHAQGKDRGADTPDGGQKPDDGAGGVAD
jgi:hypothetical protein